MDGVMQFFRDEISGALALDARARNAAKHYARLGWESRRAAPAVATRRAPGMRFSGPWDGLLVLYRSLKMPSAWGGRRSWLGSFLANISWEGSMRRFGLGFILFA